MAFPWAPVIGLAGNILGGLFGRKKKNKGPTRVTPLQLRMEAEAAGFNPITVLRGASGGGFGQNPEAVPRLSSLDVVGRALGGLAETVRQIDPIEQETRELENELLRQQIRAVSAPPGQKLEGSQWSKVPRVRSVTTSPVVKSRVAPLTQMNEPAPKGMVRAEMTPEPFVPKGQTPFRARLGGNSVNLPSFEENYGEAGELVGGVWNVMDAIATEAGAQISRAGEYFLGDYLSKKEREARARALEEYFAGKRKRPSWYKGPAKPRTSPFR